MKDRDLLPKPSEEHGALGDQMAPSQSLEALDHCTSSGPGHKGGRLWAQVWWISV